jgi:hypothetical protein
MWLVTRMTLRYALWEIQCVSCYSIYLYLACVVTVSVDALLKH